MTTTSKLAPSAIARRIAAATWPQVQQSRKVTNGVFEFQCAGHGGLVAIIDATDEGMIPAAAVSAGEREGVVIEYAVYRSGRRTKVATSQGLRHDVWAQWVTDVTNRGALVQRGKAWVGEEDCAWSTLVIASQAMQAAYIESHRATLTVPFDQWATKFASYPRECAKRWHPQYVADLDGALAAV